MNLQPTIKKEIRTLLFPWCVVTLAGLLPLFMPHLLKSFNAITAITFFAGTGLLAALPLGSEFEHRTFSLLLSQPVSRAKIWREKSIVTTIMVLSAGFLIAVGSAPELRLAGGNLWLVPAEWIVIVISSATFWTLQARSTLGGLGLTLFSLMFIDFGFALLVWIHLPLLSALENPRRYSIVVLCYAMMMLWLGRRSLLRFETSGGIVGDDLLTAGPQMMPEVLAGLFRSRPKGTTANLIRKELHLLRPVWLITALFVLCWTCMTFILAFNPTYGSSQDLQVLSLILLIGYLPLTLVLAGSLSLGEERSSGIHAWHLTLPVSVRRQWLIKLGVATLVSETCGFLIPILVISAGQYFGGTPFGYHWSPDRIGSWLWVAFVAIMTVASFLSASAVKGTVRASILTFLVLAAVYFAEIAGLFSQLELVRMKVPVSHFTMRVIDMFFPGVNSGLAYLPSQWRIAPVPLLIGVGWLALVPTLFALVESYRLFRTQPKEGMLSAIRQFLPLVGVAFLCGFLF